MKDLNSLLWSHPVHQRERYWLERWDGIKLGYGYYQIGRVLDTNEVLNSYKWRKMTLEELYVNYQKIVHFIRV